MSGLALLSGYASESDEDDVEDTKVGVAENARASIQIAAEKTPKLPSASAAFDDVPSLKRNLPISPSHDSSNKLSKIVVKRFVPPQVRLDRPNVVTED